MTSCTTRACGSSSTDVASHLLTTPERYDVISADEKTAQDYASNGFSYSREYYELLQSRLAPDGLVIQWVPTSLPPFQFRMILRTFTDAFSSSQLWYFPPALIEGAANTVLVGSNRELGLECAAVRRRLVAGGAAFDGLARYGLTSAEAVLAHFVAAGDTLRPALVGAPENTLDQPRYEFFSPADYAVPRRERLVVNQDLIGELRRRAFPAFVSAVAPDPADRLRLEQALGAEDEFLAGFRARATGRADEEALAHFEAALARADWNSSLRARIFLQFWEISGKYCVDPTYPDAVVLMRRAFAIHAGTALAHVNLGIVLQRLGALEEALVEARRGGRARAGSGRRAARPGRAAPGRRKRAPGGGAVARAARHRARGSTGTGRAGASPIARALVLARTAHVPEGVVRAVTTAKCRPARKGGEWGAMKLRVLALDYDGTIAEHGHLHPEVREAIAEARSMGLIVVLVTGRILSDLRRKLGELRLFDAVVAENGAVTAYPQAGRSSTCAATRSDAVVAALRRRGIEALAGECVVELEARHAHVALDVIHELQLPLTLHFNRGRLMVLPQAVSKATGLKEALRTMRLSVHNAIGVGDAENDHELLSACEVGAAVEWGSPALQASADLVLPGKGPEAVAAYIRTIVDSPRIVPPLAARRQLVLGRDRHGSVVSLAVKGRNVLIAGDPRSGKSWVAGLLCEQLVLQGYCLCVIDPEGDYEALEALPGMVLLGGDAAPPTLQELVRTLRHADVSVILDLVRLPQPEKTRYAVRALRALTELRRETGLPHRIVVDEAHYFLRDPDQARILDNELAGYTLITYRASALHRDILAAAECIVVTRETDPDEARLLHAGWRGSESLEHWEETLCELQLDEAVLLPGSAEAGGTLRRFRLAPRLTHHVRHRHKYMDVPVSGEAAFRFCFDDAAEGPAVRSLQELVDALASIRAERIQGHVRRGDISRWVEDVFRDARLADRIREAEEQHRLGSLPDFNGATIHAIQERYEVAGHLV